MAVVLALGWLVARIAWERDDSMSFAEMLTADAGLIPFTVGLVLVPAVVGALIGGASTGGQPPAGLVTR